MRKLKILIAGRDRFQVASAKHLLDERAQYSVEARVLTNGSVDPMQDRAGKIDLLLLGDESSQSELEFLQSMPANARPELLVFGAGDDPVSIRMAIRAGARDYLTMPLDARELHAAIESIASDLQADSPRQESTVQVFLNGKGGSGASFLASNIAHGIAVDGHSVTLVDLDLQFAGLGRYLDLTPTRDIFDAIKALDGMDRLAADAFTTKHDSGLRLLCAGTERLYLNQDIKPERLVRLLETYRQFNDYVVVDMPRQIDALNVAVLETADQVTVVTQQSFPHLHDTVRLMNILRNELHIDNSRIKVVVNRYSKNLPILMKDIETALHTDSVVRIPNQFRLTSESVNSGIPLSEVDRKASLTRELKDLFMSDGTATDAGQSRLGRALPGFFRR